MALRPLFPIELEFSSVDFCGGRKTGEPGEKPSEREREPTTNSTHIWYRAGIEPGPHWWEASALPTAPSPLPDGGGGGGVGVGVLVGEGLAKALPLASKMVSLIF